MTSAGALAVEHVYYDTGRLRMHAAVAGSGPTVVLLHGFPEYWRSWDRQIPVLAQRFRVVAVDLRGYGETDKPDSGYDMPSLSDDVAALLRLLPGKARVVAHDWGGAVAWALAVRNPELVDRVTILNAPHPVLFTRRVFRFPQVLSSWYMFFFQIPLLPELVLSLGRGFGIGVVLRKGAADPGKAYTHAELADFQAQMMQPRVLRCALEYYRAAFRGGPRTARGYRAPIQVPVQVIWGERDPALGVGLLEGMEEFVPRLQVRRIPTAGHWVQREAAAEVNESLLEWLSADPVPV